MKEQGSWPQVFAYAHNRQSTAVESSRAEQQKEADMLHYKQGGSKALVLPAERRVASHQASLLWISRKLNAR